MLRRQQRAAKCAPSCRCGAWRSSRLTVIVGAFCQIWTALIALPILKYLEEYLALGPTAVARISQGAMADQAPVQGIEAEQDLRVGTHLGTSPSALHVAVEGPVRLVPLERGWPVGMNLFVYRALWTWLNDRFIVPPRHRRSPSARAVAVIGQD